MILLDTDVCIELLRGNRKVIEHRRKAADKVGISFMTLGELFYGAAKSGRPEENRRLVEQFLLSVSCVQSDRAVMERFGLLKAGLASQGQSLPDADILVAATTLAHAEVLVTGNAAHFTRINGLRVIDWTR